MTVNWDLEKIKKKSPKEIQALYRNAKSKESVEAQNIVSLIIENDLFTEESGGLPFDHPVMLEIEEICALPEAVSEALEAANKGIPPLAGMEYRLVAALGDDYGGHYTTHHAGRCIGAAMLDLGWKQAGMKPMPKDSVARTATVYVKKGK